MCIRDRDWQDKQRVLFLRFVIPVSYTHLDVYKRQVFDNTTSGGAKFIAKLGGIGYDWLILVLSLIHI